MDWLSILMSLVLIFIGTQYLLSLLKRSKLNPERQPPGPFPLPIVGNLLGVDMKMPQRCFAELAKSHGPVMLLKLGFKNVLVVSSPSMARELLRDRDAEFAGRNVPNSATCFDHYLSSVVFLPPNSKWRAIRKITTTLLLSTDRLDSTTSIRMAKLQQLLSYVRECGKKGISVNIGQVGFSTTLGFFTNTFFSRDLVELGSPEAAELKSIFLNVMDGLKGFDMAELFPILKRLDPQGVKRKMNSNMLKLIKIFVGLIDQRVEQRRCASTSTTSDKDVLDELLDLCDNPLNGLVQSDVPHLLFDLFIAGTDSSSNTVEWAMAELFRQPDKMQKVKAELEQVIGKDNKLQETDLSRLPYLTAVVKETLRLYPSLFLVPREVLSKTKFGEFTIPKKTMVLVNWWAMARDDAVWPNADMFEPERFLDSKVDFKGQHYNLIPFGSGRRICPGIGLANRHISMMLGTLIHEFNWKLEDGVKPEDIDLHSTFGLGIQKLKPMCAIPLLKPKSGLL